MTAVAANPGMDRAETARWAVCFAAVVAAHAVAALSLFSSPQASDFDAGAPVVLLELPEVPASAATPPSDLMPGPPEEQETIIPSSWSSCASTWRRMACGDRFLRRQST